MIKFKKLDIGAYKLLKDTEIDLSKTGIAFLKGSNKDLPNFESNSVGKTSLVGALCMAIYGKDAQGNAIQKCGNMSNKEKPSFRLEFSVEDTDYILVRDFHRDTRQIFKDGVLLEITKAKDVNTFVEGLMGVNRETFVQLISVSPEQAPLFSSSNATSEGKFIRTLLNLSFIEAINKDSSEDLKQIKPEVQSKSQQIKHLKKDMDRLQESLDKAPKEDKTDYRSEISTLTERITQQKALKESLLNSEIRISDKISDIEAQLSDVKAEIRLKTKTKKEERELIKGGVCPTCKQDTAKITETVDDNSLNKLKQKRDKIEAEKAEQKAEHSTAKAELREVSSELSRLENELNKAEQGLQRQKEHNSLAKIRDSILEQLKDKNAEMMEVTEELEHLEKKSYLVELIKYATSSKGFVKLRIELFLKLLNARLKEFASELLGRQYEVSIRGDKNLNYAFIVTDSDGELEFNSLSSGFKARASILLSVALNKAIEDLTGKSFSGLFIDELLSHVDATGIEAIEELLTKIKTKFPDKLIFLISHGETLRCAENVGLIERENGESSFSWL